MPRVHTKTKNARVTKRPYVCSKCREEITPGQQYYEWEFRYGGLFRRHATCGYPRQSELTQSKMSQVYAAMEAVQDQTFTNLSDLESAMETCADEIEEVASEYEEAAAAFGYAGENQERYDELSSFASDVRDAVSNANIPDNPSPDEWTDGVQAALDVLDNCPY